jgi:hypothetical protein
MTPSLLAATWSDGVFAFTGETRRQELAGRGVRALASDQNRGALAIVDGHSLCRRTGAGVWSTIATSQLDLACLVSVGGVIYLGTDDARVLRVGKNGELDPLGGFEAVPGRDTWYAGSALINGQLVGPPLGVRSMTATSDGAVLLANVHVGDIPRCTSCSSAGRGSRDRSRLGEMPLHLHGRELAHDVEGRGGGGGAVTGGAQRLRTSQSTDALLAPRPLRSRARDGLIRVLQHARPVRGGRQCERAVRGHLAGTVADLATGERPVRERGGFRRTPRPGNGERQLCVCDGRPSPGGLPAPPAFPAGSAPRHARSRSTARPPRG